jgi:hypothetical protein
MSVLDEQGRRIPGSGFAPNRHDILTGSTVDGMAYPSTASPSTRLRARQRQRRVGWMCPATRRPPPA